MSRLQAETERLRHDEAQILASISAALEKENLDKEKPGMSSEILSRDIEEIREKIERMGGKRKEVLGGEGEKAEVKKARDEVVKCYLWVSARYCRVAGEVDIAELGLTLHRAACQEQAGAAPRLLAGSRDFQGIGQPARAGEAAQALQCRRAGQGGSLMLRVTATGVCRIAPVDRRNTGDQQPGPCLALVARSDLADL